MKSFTHSAKWKRHTWLVLVSVKVRSVCSHERPCPDEDSPDATHLSFTWPVGLGEGYPQTVNAHRLSQRNQKLRRFTRLSVWATVKPAMISNPSAKTNHLYPYRRVGGTLSRPNTERAWNAICKDFLIGIGGELPDGKPHDAVHLTTMIDNRVWKWLQVLNGDILVWNESLGCAFELSSMGIRVDEDTLRRQVIYRHEDRLGWDGIKAC